MYGIINFEVFLLAAILLNLTPGTDTMYIVSRSVSQGRKAGIYSALGITAGSVVHTILAAFGLSIVLTQSVFLFNVIKLAGAIYLAYLGIRMIIAKSANKEKVALPLLSNRKIFFQGMVTNITNPKVALFFLAFIPQFIQTSSEVSSPIPFLLLGLTFCLTGGTCCMIVAYFSSLTTKKLRGNQKMSMALNRLTGIVFIGMAVKLAHTKAAG